MRCPIPTSNSSMNHWGKWSGGTYRSKTAGSPWHSTTTGYPKEAPERAHNRQCSRSQRSQTKPVTQGYQHLQLKMNGRKGKLCDSAGHTTASMIRLTVKFYFVLGGSLMGKGQKQVFKEINETQMHDVKLTKIQKTVEGKRRPGVSICRSWGKGEDLILAYPFPWAEWAVTLRGVPDEVGGLGKNNESRKGFLWLPLEMIWMWGCWKYSAEVWMRQVGLGRMEG